MHLPDTLSSIDIHPSSAPHAVTDPAGEELARLRERVASLTRERNQLLMVVELQQELSSALQVAEVLRRLAARLGALFGLDRASIYLAGDTPSEARLVASYEDPTLTEQVVALARYPEVAEALQTGATVHIPDACTDPRLAAMRALLDGRGVGAILVVPMRWRTSVIGALVLRTEREGPPFSAQDLAFCEGIATLAARALRTAHRFEQAQRASDDDAARRRRVELERIAFVAFLQRLLGRYGRSEDHRWSETLLPRESDEELDRLVSVAMQVVAEEARGDEAPPVSMRGAPTTHPALAADVDAL